MKRWEFNAFAFDYNDDQTWTLVDNMGAEGWELVKAKQPDCLG